MTNIHRDRGRPRAGSAPEAAQGPHTNNVRKIRENLLMGKAELARKAGISPVTVDRVERGLVARPGTKRKILFALGYSIPQREQVFPG